MELATALASGSAKALGQSKRLIRASWEMDRVAVGADETRTVTLMVQGHEAQLLIARFGAP
jgi:2-(1,2-epoxy-1,2-dihydrophenyl)acetyl-CoA isomerase